MPDGISAALFCSTCRTSVPWLSTYCLSLSLRWLLWHNRELLAAFLALLSIHVCVHISQKGQKGTQNCDVWAEQTPFVMHVCICLWGYQTVCCYMTWRSELAVHWRRWVLHSQQAYRLSINPLAGRHENKGTRNKRNQNEREKWGLISIAQS